MVAAGGHKYQHPTHYQGVSVSNYPAFPVSRCPSIPVSQYPRVPISQCPSRCICVQVSQCPGVPLSLCPNVPVPWCPNHLGVQRSTQFSGHKDTHKDRGSYRGGAHLKRKLWEHSQTTKEICRTDQIMSFWANMSSLCDLEQKEVQFEKDVIISARS